MDDTSIAQIKRRLGANDPVLFVVTHEEHRVISDLTVIAKNNSYAALLVWTYGVGTMCVYASRGSVHKEGTLIAEHSADPTAPLRYVMNATDDKRAGGVQGKDVLLVLKDYGFFLQGGGGYAIGRLLKELHAQLLQERMDTTAVVIVDSESDIPPRLEKVLTLIDYDLPTQELLAKEQYPPLRAYFPLTKTDTEVVELALLAARLTAGLTLREASSALAISIQSEGTVDPRLILAEKKAIVRKSGVLEFYAAEQNLASVGGLGNLKFWLKERAHAFSEEAKVYGLPTPRALLMMGVPGCGKSLVAKTIGNEWNMPVLRMDMGSLFGSLVGESESRMRKALKTAEAVAPCVLFIDEMEKGMGQGGNDGGTTSRVFGNFLTWMSDKTAPVFVVATANNIHTLPPEMLRAGRFDATFFVDLPNEHERVEIAKIVAKKYGREKVEFTWQAIADASPGYSGAEIDRAFVDAMHNAFSARTEVTTTAWVTALGNMVPLSTMMATDVEALREWAKTRAIPASNEIRSVETAQEKAKRRFIRQGGIT